MPVDCSRGVQMRDARHPATTTAHLKHRLCIYSSLNTFSKLNDNKHKTYINGKPLFVIINIFFPASDNLSRKVLISGPCSRNLSARVNVSFH